MKYLSVCSGIEAATVAWHELCWTPVGFSEIEKFPSSVLAHHYPTIENYGDMNDFKKWPRSNVDVLVGGTPCQSFSVAGLRQGMADPRGNLALIYLAIADQYRPRWLVWENVPGVLSSDGGRDFGSIIGGMVELGYFPAYRILDAQYFGLAQRRRRVFVVASSRDWTDSAKVLFEPSCLLRNPAPRRETGQDIAPTISARTKGGGGLGTDFDLDGETIVSHDPAMTLTAREYKGPLPEADLSTVVAHSLRGEGFDASAVAFAQNQRDEVRLMNKAGALAAEPGAKQQTYVACQIADSLTVGANQTTEFPQDIAADMNAMAVRRLTPTECERLQGFPDGYTNIPGASDSGRYKALGNSMAVPVMRWIGERIDEVDAMIDT